MKTKNYLQQTTRDLSESVMPGIYFRVSTSQPSDKEDSRLCSCSFAWGTTVEAWDSRNRMTKNFLHDVTNHEDLLLVVDP